MAYATVANLRQYWRYSPGVDKDAELQTLLDRAHEIALRLVGFRFTAWPANASVQDVECRHEGRWLEPPYHETGSVAAVEFVSGRGTSSESTSAVSGWLEEADGRLYLDCGWSPGWYRIGSKWGYGPAPADAVQLDLSIAINILKGRDAGNMGSVIGAEGSGAVAYNRAVTWSERELAAQIRVAYLGVVHA